MTDKEKRKYTEDRQSKKVKPKKETEQKEREGERDKLKKRQRKGHIKNCGMKSSARNLHPININILS